MERSSSRLLASSNCTVVFGGVGRGMEGSVAKGWEGINPPAPKYGCIPPPRSTEPERLVPRPCFFDLQKYEPKLIIDMVYLEKSASSILQDILTAIKILITSRPQTGKVIK